MRLVIARFSLMIVFALCAAIVPAIAEDSKPAYTHEQLDQLTAPIALYPDTLLSQVLMASTYPADVAEAAEWSKKNTKLKGDDAVKAVESQAWDPSVKSLVAFPQLLEMMGNKPDWVQNLGDAFLASSKDVLDSVQRLRVKAKEAGNLKSNEQQKVVVKQEPAQPQVIVIESASPEVVYVPSYNPTVVYGAWPYPASPPYYYPPPPAYYPGYALASGIAFGIGVAAVGSLWGDCNWGHGDVDIDVNRYNNVNRNNQINANQNRFQHNSNNRRGVPYRDSASRQKYSRNVPGASDRANFRGRDPGRDAQRQRAQSSLSDRGMDPARGRDELRRNPEARDRADRAVRDNSRDRDGFDRGRGDGANRDRASASDRSRIGGDSNRDSRRQTERARGGGDSAFRDAGDGRRSRQQSDRGNSSRQQMSSRGGGGGSRAGGRGGGGGGRGGGGRR